MIKIVLVGDNNVEFLELMDVVLTDQGYKVVPCPESRDVYPSVKRVNPHVIILEINMPGFSGWQVIEQLKADTSTAGIPIIVCTTALLQAQERASLRRLGCTLLLKPFELDDLLVMLAKATAKRDAM